MDIFWALILFFAAGVIYGIQICGSEKPRRYHNKQPGDWYDK